MMNLNGIQKSIIVSGILLGLGMGGFFDGIVLHQILQWHHMFTSAGYPANNVENLELNTLADGLFHAVTWILTAMGLFVLLRSMQHKDIIYSPSRFTGGFLIGWGLFNLTEGIINHHILKIHHVRSGSDEMFWDIGFLIWGALMLIGGWLMIQTSPSKNHNEQGDI